MLVHVLVVPVVAREAFVHCGVGDRRAIVELERRGIVAGRREIESAHAGLLEWAAPDSRPRRSCCGEPAESGVDIEPVVLRDVEQPMFPPEGLRLACRRRCTTGAARRRYAVSPLDR